MNNTINLLDYKSKINVTQKHRFYRPLRIVAICMLFLVSALSVVLFMLIALSPLPELTKQRKKLETNLSLSVSDIVKLGLLKDRIDSMDSILKSRPRYDESLNELQKILPRGVVIDSFQISENKFLVVVNSKSLRDINEFIALLGKDKSKSKISNSRITNLSIDGARNVFLMTLNFK